jgi:hypothetical protein
LNSRKRDFAIAAVILFTAAAAYWLGQQSNPPASSAHIEDAHKAGHIPASVKLMPPLTKLAPAKSSPSTELKATRSLPAPGTSLKLTFDDLRARADAGDIAAASRLYHDLNHCSRAHREDWLMKQIAQEAVMKEEQGAKYDKALPEQFAAIRARVSILCDGLDDDRLASLTPIMQSAAQLGDPDARNCYIHRGPMDDLHSLLDNPQFLTSWRETVPSLIDSAITAGDWKTVDMLRFAYAPNRHSSLAGLLGSDADQYYRYLKLYRLGADNSEIAALDAQLLEAAANLSVAEQSSSDAWAQATFQSNFQGSSTTATPHGWDACAYP